MIETERPGIRQLLELRGTLSGPAGDRRLANMRRAPRYAAGEQVLVRYVSRQLRKRIAALENRVAALEK
jgi:hypothetical protein